MNNSIKIQELRDKYQSSFTEKSEIVSSLLSTISDAGPDSGADPSRLNNACGEIHEYLHKLAGSSGMYGYHDIAQLAREAMRSSQEIEIQVLSEQLYQLRGLLDQYA